MPAALNDKSKRGCVKEICIYFSSLISFWHQVPVKCLHCALLYLKLWMVVFIINMQLPQEKVYLYGFFDFSDGNSECIVFFHKKQCKWKEFP
jgi:hypothetical protein